MTAATPEPGQVREIAYPGRPGNYWCDSDGDVWKLHEDGMMRGGDGDRALSPEDVLRAYGPLELAIVVKAQRPNKYPQAEPPLCLAPSATGNHRCLLEPHAAERPHAVRTDRGMVTWEGDGQTRAKADGQQAERDAEPKPCVCGDPNCMPYWRPVHEQMNAMRIRLDKTSADFTKSLLEQICELATELDDLRARREDDEDERAADVRAVAALLGAVDAFRTWLVDAYDPDVPAPDPAAVMYLRADELRARYADPLAALGAQIPQQRAQEGRTRPEA